MKIYITLLLFFVSFLLFGQSLNYQIKPVTEEDFVIENSDTTSNAIVLHDIGFTSFDFFDDIDKVFFKRNCRIFITGDQGTSEGNQTIYLRHASEKIREQITDITANVYNLENGDVKKTKVDKSMIFYDLFQVKIAFPKVKKNSIIEFNYYTTSPIFYEVASWNFQSNLPVNYSEFGFEVPSYFGLNILSKGYNKVEEIERTEGVKTYQVNGVRGAPSSGTNFKASITTLRYAVKNAPKFEEESYVHNQMEYISNIKLQLAEVMYPSMGAPKKISMDWYDVVSEYTQTKIFSEDLAQFMKFKSYIPDSILILQDPIVKTNLITRLVKDRILYDGKLTKTPKTRLKEVWENKVGTSAEINLILLCLFKAANLEAFPVFASPRGNGIIEDNFAEHNKVEALIAAVKNGSGYEIRDATNRNLKDDILPLYLYNGKMIVVNNGSIVFITPSIEKIKPRKIITWDGKLSQKEPYNGVASIYFDIFESATIRRKLREEDSNLLMKKLISNSESFNVSEIKIENQELVNELLHVTFKLTSVKKTSLQNVLVSPFIYHEFNENEFLNSERTWPVDFPYPFSITMQSNITFEPDLKVDQLPKSASVELSDKSILYQINFQQNERVITSVSRIQVLNAQIKSAQYKALGELIETVINKENEEMLFRAQ